MGIRQPRSSSFTWGSAGAPPLFVRDRRGHLRNSQAVTTRSACGCRIPEARWHCPEPDPSNREVLRSRRNKSWITRRCISCCECAAALAAIAYKSANKVILLGYPPMLMYRRLENWERPYAIGVERVMFYGCESHGAIHPGAIHPGLMRRIEVDRYTPAWAWDDGYESKWRATRQLRVMPGMAP